MLIFVFLLLYYKNSNHEKDCEPDWKETMCSAASRSKTTPQFLCLKGNLAKNWNHFKQKWHNYAIITYLHSQQQQYQTALLLHMLRNDALNVYNGFHFSTPDEQQTRQEILKVFDKQAVGEINVTYEHFMFLMRRVWEHRSFYNWFADTNKNMSFATVTRYR